MSNIGKVIRKARRKKDITQDDLAQRLKVSKVTIWGWEKGHCAPGGKILLELMKELDLNPKDFEMREEVLPCKS